MNAIKVITVCLVCILAFESIAARPHRRQRDIEIDLDGSVHTFNAAENAESSEELVGIENDGPVLSRRKRSTIAFMMDAYRRHCQHNPSSCRDSVRRRGGRRSRYRSRRRHGFLIIDM